VIKGVPGLYFLGLHLMHTIKSGTLFGVGADALFIAEHMEAMNNIRQSAQPNNS
jgi:putative flavoprotein involved in K+ transport